ncbi:hypothetical protein P3003_002942 [Escherichia coli]|nr:hypothetical protein [Escherichia coli]
MNHSTGRIDFWPWRFTPPGPDDTSGTNNIAQIKHPTRLAFLTPLLTMFSSPGWIKPFR